MPDSTLAALTAATPAAGGLFYGTQGGVDRKFTLSAAGAAIAEAASAADQRTAMGAAATTALDAKLNLTGGALTGALCVPLAAYTGIAYARNAGYLFGTSIASATTGITGFNSTLQIYTASDLSMQVNYSELGFGRDLDLSWSSGTTASDGKDTFLGRGTGAASIQQGKDSATPIAQLFTGPNGSGTNISGGKMCFAAGRSTGNATPAVLAFQGSTAGSSGSMAQTLVDVLSIIRAGVIRITGIPTSSAGLSTGDVWSNGGVLTIV